MFVKSSYKIVIKICELNNSAPENGECSENRPNTVPVNPTTDSSKQNTENLKN